MIKNYKLWLTLLLLGAGILTFIEGRGTTDAVRASLHSR